MVLNLTSVELALTKTSISKAQVKISLGGNMSSQGVLAKISPGAGTSLLSASDELSPKVRTLKPMWVQLTPCNRKLFQWVG